jgi:homoserine kinase type II
MSVITKLTIEKITTLLSPYGIVNIKAVSLLSGGSENTNYRIKTSARDYVLTICEQKSLQESRQLVNLLDYLAKQGFSSSKTLKTLNGELVSQWNNKAIIVKSFIKGEIVADLPTDLLHNLGAQLASLHLLAAPSYLPSELGYGKEKFDLVKEYAPQSSFNHWLLGNRDYIDQHITKDLPKALIHSDLFYNNIIVTRDRKHATIMDFEEASYYYRVYDIGMMIVGCCCYNNCFDHRKITSFLSGYQQSITFQASEIEALQAFTVYAATATAFWRHQNYNYVNIDATMAEHYVAMKNLADEVRAISVDEFTRNFL